MFKITLAVFTLMSISAFAENEDLGSGLTNKYNSQIKRNIEAKRQAQRNHVIAMKQIQINIKLLMASNNLKWAAQEMQSTDADLRKGLFASTEENTDKFMLFVTNTAVSFLNDKNIQLSLPNTIINKKNLLETYGKISKSVNFSNDNIRIHVYPPVMPVNYGNKVEVPSSRPIAR